MGNTSSNVPTNFDNYMSEHEKDRPPMTVSVYKNDKLQTTFEAPSGFDLHKFAKRNQRGFSISSFSLINKNGQQGLDVNADGKRYIGIYKIDSDLNHYISEELKTNPPMIVSVREKYKIIEQFEAPSGFDLKKYAARFPYDKIMDLSDIWQTDGEVKVNTYGSREYTGVYRPSRNGMLTKPCRK